MGQTPLGKMYAMGTDGNLVPVISNPDGSLLVSGAGAGASYSAALDAEVGVAANQAGATLSAALAATYTGLCLSNPAGSGKNLSLLSASGVINVAPAALTAIGLIAGFAAGGITAHTTPITPRSSKIGTTSTLVAKVDAAATLVGASANAPGWIDWLAETIAATGIVQFTKNYNGSILIPPGGYVAIGASIAGPAAGFLGAFTWQELAIPSA